MSETIPKTCPACVLEMLNRPEWFPNPETLQKVKLGYAKGIPRLLSSEFFARAKISASRNRRRCFSFPTCSRVFHTLLTPRIRRAVAPGAASPGSPCRLQNSIFGHQKSPEVTKSHLGTSGREEQAVKN